MSDSTSIKKFFSLFRFVRKPQGEEAIQASWEKILPYLNDVQSSDSGKNGLSVSGRESDLERMDMDSSIRSIGQRRSILMRNRVWMGAAACVLVLAGAFWFTQGKNSSSNSEFVAEVVMASVSTGVGEMKNITLPDGTQVVLNANSTFEYPANWTSSTERITWLEGEAFFDVAKSNHIAQRKFIVKTGKLDVEVLGTRFNVNTRQQKSVVALEEGKVQLKITEGKDANRVIPMQPGDVVVLGDESLPVLKKQPVPAHISGWTRNEFHFEQTSMQEIALLFKDIYGYELVCSDSSLLERKISGDLKARNLRELVIALQVTMKIKLDIEEETKTISLSKP
jgi:transmembrane sensor